MDPIVVQFDRFRQDPVLDVMRSRFSARCPVCNKLESDIPIVIPGPLFFAYSRESVDELRQGLKEWTRQAFVSRHQCEPKEELRSMEQKKFDHVVVMILENKGITQVMTCDFVRWFVESGVVFPYWHGAAHPSGPNYRALFSGNTWSGNEYDGIWRSSIGDQVKNITFSFKGDPADRHNPMKDMCGKKSFFGRHDGETNFMDHLEDFPLIYLGMDDANNSHSGPLTVADGNVMEAINFLFAPSSWFMKGNNILFVTFDEAFGIDWESNSVFAGVAGPNIPKGRKFPVTRHHTDFYSFLMWNFFSTYDSNPLWKEDSLALWDPVSK